MVINSTNISKTNNHFSSLLNTKRQRHWKSRFWLWTGTQCGGVKLAKIKLSRLSHIYLVCSIYRLVYLYNIWRCITSEIDWSAISMNHLVVISQSNYTISFIKLLLTLVQLDPCFWLNYTVIYTLNSRHLHQLFKLRLEDLF